MEGSRTSLGHFFNLATGSFVLGNSFRKAGGLARIIQRVDRKPMTDEKNNNDIPTLYEWAGGMTAFEKLTGVFYQKVLQDELLEPVFKHMSPQHQAHVAHFIAEVFGGPAIYSTNDGTHSQMVQKHLAKHLSEQHRKRWVQLLIESADEIDLPIDPEFRSAFVAYIEWGSRIAVLNSNKTELEMNPCEPMPEWGWGVPGKPFQK